MAFWAVIILAVLGAAGGLIGTIWLQKHLVRPFVAARLRVTSLLPRAPRLRQRVFVFFALALLFVVILGSLTMPKYAGLARDGRVILATVVATDCENHGTFLYCFTLESRSYTGRGRASSVGVPCEHLRPGHQVLVYYLPWNPDTNTPGDVHHDLTNEAVFVVLAATFLPLTIVGVLSSRGLL